MPTILIKKSDTPGSVPGTVNLTNLAGGAEVAVNTADRRMFTMNSSSAVVELGTNPSSLTCADGSFTLLKAASASITNLTATSLVISNLSIASANVTTLTSASATITNLLATTLTVSGVGIFPAGSASSAAITTSGDTNTGIFFPAADTIAFAEGGTEAMRIDSSANVGIGTSSPANKLHVVGLSATPSVRIGSSSVLSAYWDIGRENATSGDFLFNNGSTTVMTLTNSGGNLGLGVTPSAWGTFKAFQTARAGLMGANNDLNLSVNGYYDGSSWRYIATAAAALYNQSGAAHTWYNIASGTAGNAITLGNPAMTLSGTSDVNLLLGTTSSAYATSGRGLIEVNGSSSALIAIKSGDTARGYFAAGSTATELAAVGASQPLLFTTNSAERARIDASGNLGIGTTTATGFNKTIRLNSASSTAGLLLCDADTDRAGFYIEAGTTTPAYVFTNNSKPLVLSVAGAERARITSSGYQFGLGTTSPSSNGGSGSTVMHLHNPTAGEWSVAHFTNGSTGAGAADGTVIGVIGSSGNFDIFNYENTSITFGTNSAERARITSGGDLLVGTTSTNGKFTVLTDSASVISGSFENNAATPTAAGLLVNFSNGTGTNDGTAVLYRGRSAGGDRFYVYGNGNVVNTNGSYGTISDAKMKTDIVDAGSQWADIKAVRFRKFKMKDDPAGLVQLGVVAQELEQVSPGLVDEHADRDAEGNDLGTTTKSVKTSVLLMKAAVALQEAMSRIEQLEAKVAALETK